VPLNELEELAAAIETNQNKRKETRNTREGPINYVSRQSRGFFFFILFVSFLFRMSFPPLCVSEKAHFSFSFLCRRRTLFDGEASRSDGGHLQELRDVLHAGHYRHFAAKFTIAA
jgi:hypothetical protein